MSAAGIVATIWVLVTGGRRNRRIRSEIHRGNLADESGSVDGQRKPFSPVVELEGVIDEMLGRGYWCCSNHQTSTSVEVPT